MTSQTQPSDAAGTSARAGSNHGHQHVMDRKYIAKCIAGCMALGLAVFVILSCVTFDPADWPSPKVAPHPAQVHNQCGRVGALIAYELFYYLGGGTYVLLGFALLGAWTLLRNRSVPDPYLRAFGAVLLMAAAAALAHMAGPPGPRSLAEGRGGIVGIFIAQFLTTHFATTGSLIVLAMALMVGLLLALDNVVLTVPRWLLAQLRALGAVQVPVGVRAGRGAAALGASSAASNVRAAVVAEPPARTPVSPTRGGKVDPRPPVPGPLGAGSGGAAAGTAPRREPLINPNRPRFPLPTQRQAEAAPAASEQTGDAEAEAAIAGDDQSGEDKSEGRAAAARQAGQRDAERQAGDRTEVEEIDQAAEEDEEGCEAEDADETQDGDEQGDDEQARDEEDQERTDGDESGAAARDGKADARSARRPVPVRQVKARTPPLPPPPRDLGDYKLPPSDLLMDPEPTYASLQEQVVRDKARVLEQTLNDFNLDAHVVEIETGPVITMFELSLAPGIKVSAVQNLANDIARALGAQAVRVVSPIAGKNTVGVEVPNSQKERVRLKELYALSGDRHARMEIPVFLGKDAHGEPLVSDLAAMPHLLIAGTTGSGKSVCINSIISALLMTQRPDHVKLILIDPKMVEMTVFKDVPHLMAPIVNDMKRAEQILEWACTKMDERYELLAEAGVKNIAAYNRLTPEEIMQRFQPTCAEEEAKIPLHMPYIVVIVDELADLMMQAAKEVEMYITRLAQKSRAVGIHLILATQRPSVNVVTGLIKSNLPARISFRVASRQDSRIVLDQNGAEALLGQGDMLFLIPGTSQLVRAQGTLVEERELAKVIEYLRTVAEPEFHPELVQLRTGSLTEEEKDELFDEAVRIIIETGRGSVSLLQRRLNVGYSRASRLIDQMGMAGVVGAYKGTQSREVLMTMEEWEGLQAAQEVDEEGVG